MSEYNPYRPPEHVPVKPKIDWWTAPDLRIIRFIIGIHLAATLAPVFYSHWLTATAFFVTVFTPLATAFAVVSLEDRNLAVRIQIVFWDLLIFAFQVFLVVGPHWLRLF